ncbi:SlyX family protein [Aquaspirillum soli]|jgi:SlyX protein
MESHLIELEIQLAYQNELVESLNATVARQQLQIDELEKNVRLLYQMLLHHAPDIPDPRSLEQEIPPHY